VRIQFAEAKLPGRSKLRAKSRRGFIPKQYTVKDDRVIVMEEKPSKVVPPKRRKEFHPKFIQVPRHWITTLRQSKSHRTYELAHIILWEAFRRKHIGGEIVLSNEVVHGMPRRVKIKAAEELERLRLINLIRQGNKALRVIPIY
jgi:hypothetical protein